MDHKAPNYIFVHGAWHGGWCWQKVTDILANKFGIKALAIDLPGHGNNKLPFKQVTMASYVQYITEIIKAQMQPVILVGHSMGGMLISQIAENIPDKIAKLIYISAFVPANNESLIEIEQQATRPSVALAVTINEFEHSISINNILDIQKLFYQQCHQTDIELALANFQPQPLLPFLGKISLTEENFGSVAKLYIECQQDQAILIEDQRKMQAKINCKIATLDTDHSPFFSCPNALVELIV